MAACDCLQSPTFALSLIVLLAKIPKGSFTLLCACVDLTQFYSTCWVIMEIITAKLQIQQLVHGQSI